MDAHWESIPKRGCSTLFSLVIVLQESLIRCFLGSGQVASLLLSVYTGYWHQGCLYQNRSQGNAILSADQSKSPRVIHMFSHPSYPIPSVSGNHDNFTFQTHLSPLYSSHMDGSKSRPSHHQLEFDFCSSFLPGLPASAHAPLHSPFLTAAMGIVVMLDSAMASKIYSDL